MMMLIDILARPRFSAVQLKPPKNLPHRNECCSRRDVRFRNLFARFCTQCCDTVAMHSTVLVWPHEALLKEKSMKLKRTLNWPTHRHLTATLFAACPVWSYPCQSNLVELPATLRRCCEVALTRLHSMPCQAASRQYLMSCPMWGTNVPSTRHSYWRGGDGCDRKSTWGKCAYLRRHNALTMSRFQRHVATWCWWRKRRWHRS